MERDLIDRADEAIPPPDTTAEADVYEPVQPAPTVTAVEGPPPAVPDAEVFVQAWRRQGTRLAATEQDKNRRQQLRLAREVVETAILALVIFLGVRALMQNYRVEGPSMEPTYTNAQQVWVNKFVYARWDSFGLGKVLPFLKSDDGPNYIFHGPERGDVVVFDPPTPHTGTRDYIKRVIATPGDRVRVTDGQIFINDQAMTEPYLPGVQSFCGGSYCEVTLGPNQYFVMGDNRANSFDSRHFGPVPGERIVGKAWLIYMPFSDFGPAPTGAPVAAGGSRAP